MNIDIAIKVGNLDDSNWVVKKLFLSKNIYCYATSSKRKVLANRHLHNKCSLKLIGALLETDIIKNKPMHSLFTLQNELF